VEGDKKKLLSILGLLVFLAGSIYFDQLFYQLEKWNNVNQPGIPPYWTELLVYVVFALLLFVLAWMVLIASQRSLWVAFIFIAAGLSGLALMTKFGIFFIWPWINKPPFLVTWLSNIIISPLALTRHAAAMILVTGLARLLPDEILRHKTIKVVQGGE
jgi:hypothetical protein